MNAQIKWINHYQQEAGVHPTPGLIEPDSMRVELMTNGRGWVDNNGTLTEVLAGDLIWNQVGDRCICRSDFKKPYRCLSIIFKDAGIRNPAIARISTWADMNEVRNFTRDLLRCFHDDEFDRQTLSAYAYSRLYFQMKKYHHHGDGKNIPSQLREVLTYIHKQYHRDITLPELATHVSWSVPHLHEMCRQHLNTSPHKLIIRHRLLIAKEQLSSKDTSIQDIAEFCGFNSCTHFCRSFKQEIGRSPKQFRSEFLEQEKSSDRIY